MDGLLDPVRRDAALSFVPLTCLHLRRMEEDKAGGHMSIHHPCSRINIMLPLSSRKLLTTHFMTSKLPAAFGSGRGKCFFFSWLLWCRWETWVLADCNHTAFIGVL